MLGSQTASAKNKAIINGISAAVSYLLSFDNIRGGAQRTLTSNAVGSFSIAKLVEAFVLGASGDLVEGVSKHSKKIIPKLEKRINTSQGRQIIKQILNDPLESKLFNKLRNENSSFNDLVSRIYYNSFSKLGKSAKLAQFFGIDSYKNLKSSKNVNEFRLPSLGIPAGTKVQVHHLVEVRFADRPGVREWLGQHTDSWKGIVLTAEDHQTLTNAWIQQIGRNNMKGELRTITAKLEDIKGAARKVYADYPEILEALNL